MVKSLTQKGRGPLCTHMTTLIDDRVFTRTVKQTKRSSLSLNHKLHFRCKSRNILVKQIQAMRQDA